MLYQEEEALFRVFRITCNAWFNGLKKIISINHYETALTDQSPKCDPHPF